LRLSGVCKRWNDLVQNDVLFMKTVKFHLCNLDGRSMLMRSYKNIDLGNCAYKFRVNNCIPLNSRYLMSIADSIDFGLVTHAFLNRIMPLCTNVKEIKLENSLYRRANNRALTFEHSVPVEISIRNPCLELFDRFKVITNILQLNDTSQDIMAKYGAVITSLNTSTSELQELVQLQDLHLQSLCLTAILYVDTEKNSAIVRTFFEKQALVLTIIKIEYCPEVLFDAMHMLLKNLETVKISYCQNKHELHFNDLKVLPKLKCLDVHQVDINSAQYYHLDVSELVTLAELRVSINLNWDAPTLRITSGSEPMVSLKKFCAFNCHIDFETLEQIVQTMPELKTLDVKLSVRVVPN
jgi:hypothetical protein